MKTKFTAFLLFVSLIIQAQTTYYIDPSGSDATGNGTVGNPWKSLYKACATVRTSGNIIHVNAGTFIENSKCELAQGVSIEGEGVTSIIKSSVGGKSYTIELYNEAQNTKGNQHISDIMMDGNNLTAYGAIAVLNRGNVEIYNCTIINFNYWGVTFNNGAPPTIYATGNKLHDCIITNCAGFYGGAQGDIRVGGQDGLLIYNNTVTQYRGGANDGDCIYGVEGFIKNVKIYNNTFSKTMIVGTTKWDFAIEIWNWLGGNEIYNNTITGSIDVVLASKGSSAYSVWIHDNSIGQAELKAKQGIRGILLEYGCSDVIIEKNYIHDVAQGVFLQQGEGAYAGGSRHAVSNIQISYNIIYNIGAPDSYPYATGWGIYWSPETLQDDNVNNINVWNNVIIAHVGSCQTVYGIGLPDVGTATNVNIRNNIVQGFYDSPIYAKGGGGATINNLSIENNIFFGNGNSNLPHYTGGIAPTNNITQNNIISNPLFVSQSASDFHVKSGSPAINKGIHIASLLSDYDGNSVGNPPEIGAFEFNDNHPPSIQDQGFRLNENSPDGTAVGTVVISDPAFDN
jgi:hypothetical protein